MARLRYKAQAMVEFALLLAVVAVAIGSMTIYVRRSLQARYHAAALRLIENVTGEGKHQYEPYYTREAFRSEKQKGDVTTGWGTISVVDMTSEGYGWEHTPLPERWSK